MNATPTEAPLVSVLIPAYAGAAVLPDAFASLRMQTESRWEAIVVDDGSPDDTRAVAEAYTRVDHRIRVMRWTPSPSIAIRRTCAALPQVLSRTNRRTEYCFPDCTFTDLLVNALPWSV